MVIGATSVGLPGNRSFEADDDGKMVPYNREEILDILRRSTDGVLIRYAGECFECGEFSERLAAGYHPACLARALRAGRFSGGHAAV